MVTGVLASLLLRELKEDTKQVKDSATMAVQEVATAVVAVLVPEVVKEPALLEEGVVVLDIMNQQE